MFACACANPACQVNGCAIANDMRDKYFKNPGYNPWLPAPMVPVPMMPTPQAPVPMGQIISEELIRRIVREEIIKVLQERSDAK